MVKFTYGGSGTTVVANLRFLSTYTIVVSKDAEVVDFHAVSTTLTLASSPILQFKY